MNNSETSNIHTSKVIAVRGNVVDVHFSLPLPARNRQLRVSTVNWRVKFTRFQR